MKKYYLLHLIVLALQFAGITANAQGNMLDFDGTNDFVNLGYNNLIPNNQNFTIEFWLYHRAPQTDAPIISNKNWASGNNTGFVLFCDNTGKVRISYKGSVGARRDLGNIAANPDIRNRWAHVVMRVQNRANTTTGRLELMIDGTSIAVFTGNISGTIEPALNYHLGQDGTGNYTPKFNGRLEELRIWGTYRTDTELGNTRFRELTAGEVSSADLLKYYKFNQNLNSTTLPDEKAGASGTLTNFGSQTNLSNFYFSYAAINSNATAATLVSSNLFQANWDALASLATPTNYFVQVSTNSSFTVLVTGYENLNISGANLNASITGLNESTTYYYRVRAFRTPVDQFSQWSATITVNTPAAPLSSPTLTSVTGLGNSAFTINWNSVGGATAYQVDVALDAGFTNFVVNNSSTTNTNFQQTGLNPGQIYYYRVRATNGVINSVYATGSPISTTMDAPGNCLYANATTNDNINLNFNDLGTSNFTVEMWVYIPGNPAFGTDPVLFGNKDWASGSNTGLLFWVQPTGILSCNFKTAAGLRYDFNTTVPITGRWCHLALTVNRTGNAVLYVDGQPSVTQTVTGATGTINGAYNFRLNQDGTGIYGPKNSAAFDEFKVWNRVLSAGEIAAGMNSTITNPGSLSDLMHYFDFDHVQGTLMLNKKGGTAAQLNNFALTGSISNWVPSLATFRPVSGPGINVDFDKFTTQRSLPANYDIISLGGTTLIDVASTSNFSTLVPGYSQLSMGTNSTQLVENLNPSTAYYYRTALTRMGAPGISQYSNVITVNTANIPAGVPVLSEPSNFSTSGFRINWNVVASSVNYRIDVSTQADFSSFVSGYNNAITTNNFLDVSGLNDGTVYYFRLRSFNGTDVSASSTILSGITLMDAPGNALAFDGINDYLDLGFNDFGTSSFSLQMWLNLRTRPSIGTADAPFFSNKDWNSGTNTGLVCWVDDQGRIRINFKTASSTRLDIIIPGDITGRWVNFAMTVNRAGNFITYINGVQTTINSVASLNGTLDGAFTFKLGQDGTGTYGIRFDGLIDEFCVWNKSLSAAEVMANVGLQQANFWTNNDLRVYYSFNQKAGAVAQPNKGSITGTINNFNFVNPTSGWVPSFGTLFPAMNPVTGITFNGAQINWAAWNNAGPGNPATYELEVATDAAFTSFLPGYSPFNVGTSISHSLTTLSPSSTYYVRVSALGSTGLGKSTRSLSLDFTTNAAPAVLPGVPTGLTIQNITFDGFTVTWTAGTNATSHLVDVSSNASFTTLLPGFNPASTTDNFLVVTGLNQTTTYYIRVRGQNADGSGPNTAAITAFTLPAIVPNQFLDFDGTNDFVDLGTGSTNWATTGNFTVQLWYRPTATGTDPPILSNKNWANGINTGFVFFTDNLYKLRMNFKTSGSTRVDFTSTKSMVVNRWNHIAFSVDRSGSLRMYLNGEDVGGGSISGLSGTIATTFSWKVLQDATGVYSPRARGQVDQLSIHNIVLSAIQLAAVRVDGITLPQAGILGYYGFDHANTAFALNEANSTLATLQNFALSGLASNYLGGSPVVTFKPTLNNNFNNPGNWSTGNLPDATVAIARVVVPINARTINVSANIDVPALEMENQPSFQIASNVRLNIKGDMNGQCQAIGDGTLNFGGSETQFINGILEANQVRVDKPITIEVIANQATTISRSLEVSSGTFNANAFVTMRSRAAGSAKVLPVGTNGAIQGIFDVERYYERPSTTTSNNGAWMMIGAPILNITLQQFNEFSGAGGFSGAYVTGGSPTVYYYSNTGNPSQIGWTSPTNISNGVPSGKGIQYFFRRSFLDGGRIGRFSGLLYFGNFSFPVSLCTTGCTWASSGPANGWNLLANPYLCELDWESPNWTKTNIDAAIHVYSQDIGGYRAYVPGIGGVNGGRRYIAPGQGFMIMANASNPVLTARENTKVTNENLAPFRVATEDSIFRLRIKLIGNTTQFDEVMWVMHPAATPGYDSQFDALKISATQPSISLMMDGQNKLAISSSELNVGDTVSIWVKAILNNNYTLNFEGDILSQFQLLLQDKVTGEQKLLLPDEAHAFSANTSNETARFKLILVGHNVTSNLNPLAGSGFYLYPNPTKNRVNIEVPGVEKGQIEIFNLQGKLVMKTQLQMQSQILDISPLQKGVYIFNVRNKNGKYSRKLIVE